MKLNFPRNVAANRHDIVKAKRERNIIVTAVQQAEQVLSDRVSALEVPGKGTPVLYSIIGNTRNGGVVLNNDLVIAGEDGVFEGNTLITFEEVVTIWGALYPDHRLLTKAEWDDIRASIIKLNYGLQGLDVYDYINDDRIYHAWYWFVDADHMPFDDGGSNFVYQYNSVTGATRYESIDTPTAKFRCAIEFDVLSFIEPYSTNNDIIVSDTAIVTAYNPERNILNVPAATTAEQLLGAVIAADNSDQLREPYRRVDDWHLGSTEECELLATNLASMLADEGVTGLIWTSTDDSDIPNNAWAVDLATGVRVSTPKVQAHNVIPIRMFQNTTPDEFNIGGVGQAGIIFSKELVHVESNTYEYYEIAIDTLSTGEWSSDPALVVPATVHTFGEGYANTATIIDVVGVDAIVTAAAITILTPGFDYDPIWPTAQPLDIYTDELRVYPETRYDVVGEAYELARIIKMNEILLDDIDIEPTVEAAAEVAVDTMGNIITITDGAVGDPTTKTVAELKVSIQSTTGAWQFYQMFRDGIDLEDTDIVEAADVFRVTSDSFNFSADYTINVNPN